MNYWIYFSHYAFVAIICWLICMLFQVIKLKRNKMLPILLFAALGGLSMIVFTYNLWQNLGRPPMRTLGETRLWYAVFLPLIGIITYIRWQYKWLLNYSLVMATVFLAINYFNPDTYNKALMPALQSVWFVPHVLVYIFSYALLAASSIVACYGLFEYYRGKYKKNILELANNLVYVGFGFLSLGLLFGALWAKEAWGHYWTWDPKETWAMLTWLGYLIYIHIHYRYPESVKPVLITLALAFVVLLLCWFGVNYMPSSAQSVHTYTNG
ncbi:cytochrome c biogenesis protein [Flavobacterium bizetiae]|uniref:cytochrome c biogenesis protein n=1 Tax=Flavobacterium bizetiae TaxID=2704140 RepID=UPI00375663B7